MSRVRKPVWAFGAAVALGACALAGPCVPGAWGQDADDPPPMVGAVSVSPSGDAEGVAVRLGGFWSSVTAWASPPHGEERRAGSWIGAWGGPAAALASGEGGAWALRAGSWPLPHPEGASPAGVRGGAAAFVVDIGLDCNALRRVSSQPFSASARGRVFGALGLANARRARLTLLRDEGSEGGERLSAVFFTESRSEPPGSWRAVRLCGVGEATRRPEARMPEGPLEADFGSAFGEVFLRAADGVVVAVGGGEGLTRLERFAGLGAASEGAIERLSRAFEGRVWFWEAPGEGGVVAALPLARGTTDADVARAIGVLAGQRLVWARDADGRPTGTLMLGGDEAAGGVRLSLRFVRIVRRTSLVVSTSPGGLEGAAGVLAELPQ